jgi:hypothetical protein
MCDIVEYSSGLSEKFNDKRVVNKAATFLKR